MQQTTTAGTAADCQAADQTSQFSKLPAALLTRILQSLPQRERLTSCATVCKSWAAASAAASVEVDVNDFTQHHGRIAAFEPWLEQHASQLVSLRVQDSSRIFDWFLSTNPKAEFHLPCRQLQQLSRLDLEGLEVCFNPAASSSSSSGSSNAGAAPMLAKLQQLRLHSCKLSRSTFLQLAQLSGVTQLDLEMHCDIVDDRPVESEAVKTFFAGLSNLECLRLAGDVQAAVVMPVLPAHSLTTLTSYHVELPDSASRLVNLRELKLTAGLNSVALASMTLLTKLQLMCCRTAAGVDDNISGSLAAVRGMHMLQHLLVYNDADALLRAAEPRACAALTAYNQLTYLEINALQAQPLPATALQHMFPAGKQLPRLQYFGVRTYHDLQDAGCITTAELRSLVDTCPALTRMDLTCVLAPGADVSALLKLPRQCQHLGVGGQAFGDKAAGVVAQLTQVTSLAWTQSPGFTDAGLAGLTALHALDTLSIFNTNSSLFRSARSLKAGGQSVSQQLCELLLAAPSSGPWKQH